MNTDPDRREQAFATRHGESMAQSVSHSTDGSSDKSARKASGQYLKLWADTVLDAHDARTTLKSAEKREPIDHAHLSKILLLRRQQTTVEHDDSGEAPSEYELVRELESGGMGTVYLAKQTSLDRVIALKKIKPEMAKNYERRNDFLSEAVILGELEHPNIVPIYDAAVNERGHPFYAMRCVRGTVWSKVMGKVSREDNLDVLLKVTQAVMYAHSRGIIHRDLKPDNVMLGDYGEVMVMDWGIAAAVEDSAKAPPLTRRTALGGTPAYMAPEMARGDHTAIGKHSDIYLLGAILYEIVTGYPPHCKKDVVACIVDAARNIIEPARQKGELVRIALKAMATDPAQRFGSARVFMNMLVTYRRHAESLRLVSKAEEEAERAEREERYAPFTEAVADYKQALKLWENNPRACQGLSRALKAYAELAMRRKDLELAAHLLDANVPEHADALAQLSHARRLRSLRRRNLRRLRGAAAACFIAILIFLVRDYVHRFGKWEQIFAATFSEPDDLEGLAFSHVNLTADVAPDPVDENGLRLEAGHMCWFRELKIWNNVRVEFEVCWPDQVDGFEILINSVREQPPVFGQVPPGYSCQFGGWRNTCDYISRNEKSRDPIVVKIARSRYRSGRFYRLVFQRMDDEFKLIADGRTVLRRIELLPMSGWDLCRVGVRSWSDIHIRVARVYRMSLPRKANPITIGDALYAEGNYRAAVRHYINMAGDFEGEGIEEKALVKAYLTSFQIHDDMEALRRNVKRIMGIKYPGSPYRLSMLEAECRHVWRDNAYDTAFALLAEIMRRDRDHRMAVALLEELDAGVPPAVRDELLARVACTTHLKRLNVSGLALTNLAFATGLKLNWLDCSANRIADLEPLRRMPLIYLDCANNEISDLSALSQLKLRVLCCDNNRIADLEPLRSLPLQTLACRNNQIGDVTALQGLPLWRLHLDGNDIVLPPWCDGMPLRTLTMADNRLESLDALRHAARLETLDVRNNRLISLAPLADAPLRVLHASGNPLHNLAPYESAPPAEEFTFDIMRFEPDYLEQLLNQWRQTQAPTNLIVRICVERAFAVGDAQALHAMAQEYKGRRYLLVPVALRWDEAREKTQAMGAHLLTLADADEARFACSLLTDAYSQTWLGLILNDRGEDRWTTGEPVVYRNYHSWKDRNVTSPRCISLHNGDCTWVTADASRMSFIIEW